MDQACNRSDEDTDDASREGHHDAAADISEGETSSRETDEFKRGMAYQKDGLSRSFHGSIFQAYLTLCFLYGATKHIVNKKIQDFRLGGDIKEVNDLDDIMLQYKLEEEWRTRLVQVKHKEKFKSENDEGEKITLANLLKTGDQEFSLVRYFQSFVDVKHLSGQETNSTISGTEIEDVILCTNIGVSHDAPVKEVEKDDILENLGTMQLYKLNLNKVQRKALFATFDQTSELKVLVRLIVENIVGNGQELNYKSNPVFSKYKAALATDVLRERKNSPTTLFFQDKFINGDDENVREFREELIRELAFRKRYKESVTHISSEKVINDAATRGHNEKLGKTLDDIANGNTELKVGSFDWEDCIKIKNYVIFIESGKFRPETKIGNQKIPPVWLRNAVPYKTRRRCKFVVEEGFGNEDDPPKKVLEELASLFVEILEKGARNKSVSSHKYNYLTSNVIVGKEKRGKKRKKGKKGQFQEEFLKGDNISLSAFKFRECLKRLLIIDVEEYKGYLKDVGVTCLPAIVQEWKNLRPIRKYREELIRELAFRKRLKESKINISSKKVEQDKEARALKKLSQILKNKIAEGDRKLEVGDFIWEDCIKIKNEVILIDSGNFVVDEGFGNENDPSESVLEELTDTLVDYLENCNRKLSVNPIRYKYLTSNVLTKEGKFQEKFLKGDNVFLSASKLREALKHRLINVGMNHDLLKVVSVKSVLAFVQEWKFEGNLKIMDYDKFAEYLKFLIDQKDKVIISRQALTRIKSKKETEQFITQFCALAGHVFMKVRNGIFQFSTQFLELSTEAKHRIQKPELIDLKLALTKASFEPKDTHTFEVSDITFQTYCDLPHKLERRVKLDFLEKFKLAVNIPNRNTLPTDFQNRVGMKKAYFCMLAHALQTWMADREGAYFTPSAARELFRSIESDIIDAANHLRQSSQQW